MCEKENCGFSLEKILHKTHGLIDIKIKTSIRDAECLSMVYTPGVATPCLEIQKDITKAYELTNKANSILIVTDSSAVPSDKKWNNNAAMPYLEAFSLIYKHLVNVDAYPIILDTKLIPDAETLVDTVNAISPSYTGVELFCISPEKMGKFEELFSKSEFKNKYAYLDASNKREIDEMLKTKNTGLSSNAIFALIWRAVLDSRAYGRQNQILDYIVNEIKTDKIDLTKHNDFYVDYHIVFSKIVDYIFDNKLFSNEYDKYDWKDKPLTKEYIHEKLTAFQFYGTKAWVEEMPRGYYMNQHTNPENALLLHHRNRGVIEIEPKLALSSPRKLKTLLCFSALDEISAKIAEDPALGFDLTCKNNYGAIITNGTAVLGLGNIGALAGMPVMEGKSVLFKYFGGTNICPICIQELDNDKLIAYVQRIAPSFSIINLEDIKGPDCFYIENKLIETVECPIFHDDQHGTACVVLAGLINAMKKKKKKPDEVKIVMNGAGAAGIAVCSLLMHYGFKNFIVCDTQGAIYKGRPKNMNPFKEKIAELTNPDRIQGKLSDVIKGADVVIGLSGPNTITEENVKSMNPDPVVFALANPIPEIYPDAAKKAGAFIVATGRSDFPNQINNSLVFPGIFRGTIDTRAPKITIDMKVAASTAVANMIKDSDLRPDYIMPSALDVGITITVATEVAKVVLDKKLTSKTNVDIDKLRENIHSYFIDETLTDVDKTENK